MYFRVIAAGGGSGCFSADTIESIGRPNVGSGLRAPVGRAPLPNSLIERVCEALE